MRKCYFCFALFVQFICPFIRPFNSLIHSVFARIPARECLSICPFIRPFGVIIFFHLLVAKCSHISENAPAAVFRLLLVRPVVGHIPVLTLLELHMVLGLTHILQFCYSQSAHISLRIIEIGLKDSENSFQLLTNPAKSQFAATNLLSLQNQQYQKQAWQILYCKNTPSNRPMKDTCSPTKAEKPSQHQTSTKGWEKTWTTNAEVMQNIDLNSTQPVVEAKAKRLPKVSPIPSQMRTTASSCSKSTTTNPSR